MAIAVAHWDHPRVCGEHISIAREKVVSSGSSPRVRGTQALVHLVDAHLGIIPACAGNTPRRCRRSRPTRDHPRVCGEHAARSMCRLPPLGIIPACAGNTQQESTSKRKSRDHPRVCGEHLVFWYRATTKSGSSPRVRGTPPCRAACRRAPGIIPACAGNTSAASRRCRPRRDHPRVCGEHMVNGALKYKGEGSSPRVRGTRIRHVIEPAVPGIIPACAGNTQIPAGSWLDTRDHPRVCGEHAACGIRGAAYPGSSPRVRGTPPQKLGTQEE